MRDVLRGHIFVAAIQSSHFHHNLHVNSFNNDEDILLSQRGRMPRDTISDTWSGSELLDLRTADPSQTPSVTENSRPSSVRESEAESADLNRTTSNSNAVESVLLPADGGKDAWLFLFSSFIIEAFVWGASFRMS